jgi:hypothetical protein
LNLKRGFETTSETRNKTSFIHAKPDCRYDDTFIDMLEICITIDILFCLSLIHKPQVDGFCVQNESLRWWRSGGVAGR